MSDTSPSGSASQMSHRSGLTDGSASESGRTMSPSESVVSRATTNVSKSPESSIPSPQPKQQQPPRRRGKGSGELKKKSEMFVYIFNMEYSPFFL